MLYITKFSQQGLGLLLVGLLLLSGCGLPINHGQSLSEDLQHIPLQRRLEQLWVYTGNNTGGYRSISSLLAPPSLYTTAWTLRITSSKQIPVPDLQSSQVAKWLTSVLTDLTSGPDEDFSVVESLWLASHALADLEQPLPATAIKHNLERVRVNDRYAANPGEAPSWIATQKAVEILQLIQADVPATLPATVMQALTSATTETTSVEAMYGIFIPLWQLAGAVVPEAARQTLWPELHQRLRSLSAIISAEQPSGATLQALVDIHAIAQANHILLPPADAALYEQLRTPNGYLSVFPNSLQDDPQATYYGVALGMPVSERLVHAIRSRANSTGWWLDNSNVDPRTSFYATFIAHTLKDTSRDAAMRRQTEQWLAELSCTTDSTAFTSNPARTAFVLRLAQELEFPIPAEVSICVQHAHAALIKTGVSPKDNIWWLIIVDVLNVVVPSDVQQALERAMVSQEQKTMFDVYTMLVAGRVLHQPSLHERAKHIVSSLTMDGSNGATLYRATEQLSQSDVRSTVAGLWASGALKTHGSPAATFFTDHVGTWVATPGTEIGTGNDVTMQTLYFGALLANGTTNDDLIMW